MGHQQIKPVNNGIYMVRTLNRRGGSIHKGPIEPARYSTYTWEWDGEPDEVTECWEFFGTEITGDPSMVEVVAGPII